VKIFISYRRDGSGGFARSIANRLRDEFGPERLFVDVDSIAAGEDFVRAIRAAVAECDVLLALIGPNWTSARKKGERGRRLDNPNDYVRIEIAAALRRQIPVIPLLLEDARMPHARELPKGLKTLARRQAHSVRNPSFNRDVDSLIEIISALLGCFRWKDTDRQDYDPVGIVSAGDLVVILEKAAPGKRGRVMLS
jgi:hypothetical protein